MQSSMYRKREGVLCGSSLTLPGWAGFLCCDIERWVKRYMTQPDEDRDNDQDEDEER